jgi:hypothetical protein
MITPIKLTQKGPKQPAFPVFTSSKLTIIQKKADTEPEKHPSSTLRL